jgi:hypothetical protein
MKDRSRDRPQGVDGDSPLADRILTPRGRELGHREGRSNVVGIGQVRLATAQRAVLVAGVVPPRGWRPIQSP